MIHWGFIFFGLMVLNTILAAVYQNSRTLKQYNTMSSCMSSGNIWLMTPQNGPSSGYCQPKGNLGTALFAISGLTLFVLWIISLFHQF